jgi:Aspartyl protease
MRRALLMIGGTAGFLGLITSPAMAAASATDQKSHVHASAPVNLALPSKKAGCGGASALGGGAQRIPIKVTTAEGQVGEVVNVCISGMGPFPFEIDTGSPQSGIDTHLAAQLHLADVGPPLTYEGVGCTGTAQQVMVPSWSLGGVPLAAQPVIADIQPGLGGSGEPVGLLGSDVLNRFGAVRLDFNAKTLTLEGSEGPDTAAAGAVVHGPTGPSPSAVLTHGQKGSTVPITVDLSPGNIAMVVPVKFGNGAAQNFVIDTGALGSDMDTKVAADAQLKHTDMAHAGYGACNTTTAVLVQSGRWSVPGLTLRPQLLEVESFGAISAGGIVGTLGSDQLARFGWVIFDYRGGRLIVG